MTREEAKEFYPILQAYAEGKTLQVKSPEFGWTDCLHPSFDCKPNVYRIKPEPTYRPFKDAEECWNEMLKHQPFGWIKKTCGHCNFLHIMELYSTGILINNVDNFGSFRNLIKTYDSAFAETTFADGTPFGIKEE